MRNGIHNLLFLSNQFLRPITNRLSLPHKFLSPNNRKPKLPVKIIRCRIGRCAVDFTNQPLAVFQNGSALQIFVKQSGDAPAPIGAANHHPVDIVESVVACLQPAKVGIVVGRLVIKTHQQGTTVWQRPDMRGGLQQFNKCRNRLERQFLRMLIIQQPQGLKLTACKRRRYQVKIS